MYIVGRGQGRFEVFLALPTNKNIILLHIKANLHKCHGYQIYKYGLFITIYIM